MPTHGPAGPVIVGERVRPDANLRSQAPDDRRCKVGLLVWETAVLAPKRKLRRKAGLAGVGEVGQMRQIAGQKRPVLVKLACRPLLPHCRTPSTPNERSLQAGNQRRNVRWPKCTASWSLGLDRVASQYMRKDRKPWVGRWVGHPPLCGSLTASPQAAIRVPNSTGGSREWGVNFALSVNRSSRSSSSGKDQMRTNGRERRRPVEIVLSVGRIGGQHARRAELSATRRFAVESLLRATHD